MSPNPAVAVVIPVRDRAELLSETLASLTSQTSTDWEAWVVDDGSQLAAREATRRLVEQTPGVQLLCRESGPAGAAHCRNLGVRASRAPYVIFLDSDDLLAAGALEERVAALDERSDCDLWVRVGEVFQRHPGDLGIAWNDLLGDDDLDRFLACDTPWQTTAPIWRRPALARIGLWDERALSWQDWELHVRALACGLRIGKEDVVDYHYRRTHSTSMRGRQDEREKLIQRAQLFASVHATLKTHGQVSTLRERLLCGLFARFAFKCARIHAEVEGAVQILEVGRETGVLTDCRLEEAIVLAGSIANRTSTGEEDPRVRARFPELDQVCHSAGRARAKGQALSIDFADSRARPRACQE